jgi:hypothetical protein
VALIRLRPAAAAAETLRAVLTARFDVLEEDGIISVHLIEGDPDLSRLLVPNADNTGAGDWYVVIDGTSGEAVAKATQKRFTATTGVVTDAEVISFGVYQLLTDISRAELDF